MTTAYGVLCASALLLARSLLFVVRTRLGTAPSPVFFGRQTGLFFFFFTFFRKRAETRSAGNNNKSSDTKSLDTKRVRFERLKVDIVSTEGWKLGHIFRRVVPRSRPITKIVFACYFLFYVSVLCEVLCVDLPVLVGRTTGVYYK